MDLVPAEVASTLGGLVLSVPAVPLPRDRQARVAQLVLGAGAALALFAWWVVAML